MNQTTQDESKANLLDVLSELVGMVEAFPAELHEKHPLVIEAREAIKKAKGEI